MHKIVRNSIFSLALGLFAAHAQGQTITIASSTSDTICTGTMVTFSATPAGTGTPHFQWLKNSVHVGVDSNHYSTSGLANGDVIMCELMTAPAGPIVALSGPRVMRVDAMPYVAGITGSATVCLGGTTTLTDSTTGAVWSSNHPLIASISAGGMVTGTATGVDTIYYTLTNTCGTAFSRKRITVITAPNLPPITGPGNICLGAGTATYTDTDTTGTWSLSNTAIATIAGGVVTPTAVGVDTVLYTASNGCGSTTRRRPVNILAAPVPQPISGSSTVCQNDTIHLYNPVNGGIWRSSDNILALVGSGGGAGGANTGIVRGLSGGTVTITYLVFNACGADSVTMNVTVSPLPVVYPITGSRDSVCQAGTIKLNEFTTGGTWSSKLPSLATVDASGNVTGLAPGIDTIFYAATNSCGSTTQAYAVYVYCPYHVGVPGVNTNSHISIYPNPASDMITIEGTNPSQVQLVNIYGQTVLTAKNTNTLSLTTLPDGVYYMTVFDENGSIAAKQSVVKR